MKSSMNKILDIKNLDVSFPSQYGTIHAVKDINISLKPGEILGIVGESGAGKSTIGNAIINLLEPPGKIINGKIIFNGQDLRYLNDKQMQDIRGNKIGMIFQDPQTSLNPLMTIGSQLIETINKTTQLFGNAAYNKAVELLKSVGIEKPELRLKSYPHQFSGGMRQRVVISLALAGNPDLIIADEPTTALDVSIQAQILDLIKKLCLDRKLGVIIITHDIGVIASIANQVAVMYSGKIVENGNVNQILNKPKHEYTKSLIAAVPPSNFRIDRFKSIDYIEGGSKSFKRINIHDHWLGEKVNQNLSNKAIYLNGLNKKFILKKAIFRKNRIYLNAIDNVSLEIKKGESFGLVGESGSGKSTLARIIAGLTPADSGSLKFFEKEVLNRHLYKGSLDERRSLQMIFQDPYSSLNARMRVYDIISEPIKFNKSITNNIEIQEIVKDLLEHVGLDLNSMFRYPHEFSGGQRQRISIARALASRPKILICDEPTSSLDVSVQAHILNLLKDLQDELGLTMLFISHDLPVIRQMCDKVAVMRNGSICEIASTEKLFKNPQHFYTKQLLNLMPKTHLTYK